MNAAKLFLATVVIPAGFGHPGTEGQIKIFDRDTLHLATTIDNNVGMNFDLHAVVGFIVKLESNRAPIFGEEEIYVSATGLVCAYKSPVEVAKA